MFSSSPFSFKFITTVSYRVSSVFIFTIIWYVHIQKIRYYCCCAWAFFPPPYPPYIACSSKEKKITRQRKTKTITVFLYKHTHTERSVHVTYCSILRSHPLRPVSRRTISDRLSSVLAWFRCPVLVRCDAMQIGRRTWLNWWRYPNVRNVQTCRYDADMFRPFSESRSWWQRLLLARRFLENKKKRFYITLHLKDTVEYIQK